MRDIVVVGGGLSGLAACHELARLGARYTIIEVKRRFGGGIRSSLARGFLMDGCAFVYHALADDRLTALGLAGQQARGDGTALLRGGSESLIAALAKDLRGGRLMRMALSSLGWLGGRFTLCLENGIMLDARALILALPARYAARALYNLSPGTAELLAEFRYDSLARVSLGARQPDMPADFVPQSSDCAFVLATDAPGRVPDRDHVLLQVGLRSDDSEDSQQLIARASRLLDIHEPLVARVDRWPEADLLPAAATLHADRLRAIHASLPGGISLVGSDYGRREAQNTGIVHLDERMDMGREAARSALAFLRM
ncbi:MAG: FAD-dependent oxidoreductase [Chloroflexi bacterium]|nr:FAD-dependent oxidoreductase [Chloroflexota bacterium]MCY4246192.1 FAD-dependent oxidoreductase [Chloroflexota bacterium]